MRKTAILVWIALAALVPAQAARQPYVPSKGIAARSAEVDAKVVDLTQAIPWHESLDEAKAVARRTGKPIFWMHMLGSLSGST